MSAVAFTSSRAKTYLDIVNRKTDDAEAKLAILSVRQCLDEIVAASQRESLESHRMAFVAAIATLMRYSLDKQDWQPIMVQVMKDLGVTKIECDEKYMKCRVFDKDVQMTIAVNEHGTHTVSVT